VTLVHGELGEFVKHDADFKKLDVQILALSVDPPEKAKWVEEKLKAPFPILSDSKREVIELYGTRSPEYHNREKRQHQHADLGPD
jgi:peroxiredoxin